MQAERGIDQEKERERLLGAAGRSSKRGTHLADCAFVVFRTVGERCCTIEGSEPPLYDTPPAQKLKKIAKVRRGWRVGPLLWKPKACVLTNFWDLFRNIFVSKSEGQV